MQFDYSMNFVKARKGPIFALCALLLCGCDNLLADEDHNDGPKPATQGEARALLDAEAMLDERPPLDELKSDAETAEPN